MSEPNTFEDFESRFDSLQKEAQGYGIETAVVMIEQDKLDRTESKWIGWVGGPVQTIGMLAWAKHRMFEELENKRA